MDQGRNIFLRLVSLFIVYFCNGQVSVRSHEGGGCPNHPVYLLGMNGTFTSPYYPRNYPNYAHCEWTIQVPYGYRILLSFTAFDTESGFDFVEISSNSTGLHGRYSGSTRPSYLQGGQQMIARFTSDGSVNRGGFRAEFTATYDPSPTRFPTTSQPGVGCPNHPVYLYGRNGTFTSPNFPGNYPNNARCEWRIQVPYGYRIQLSFTAFDTESDYDFVEISSNSTGLHERYNGSRLPPSLEGGHRMVARFRSDGSVNRRGFRAQFTAIYDSPHPTQFPTAQPAGGCPDHPVYLYGRNGTFTSPNFPGNYPNNARCEWRIQVPYGYRVRLSFTEFDTESGYDFVEISSNSTGLHERHSGSSLPLSSEGGQRMVVRFRSDGSVNRRGFRAQFTAIYDSPHPTQFPTAQPGVGCPNYPVYLYGRNGTFTSPNFPGNYPNNARCEWRIQVPYGYRVRLSFTEFDTESGYDFVEISSNSTGLNERYNGSRLPPSLLGGQRMVAIFRSDGSVKSRGFRAEFTAIYDSPPTRFPTAQPAGGCSNHPVYLYGMNGTFTSPNFPGNYPNNARCEWRIQVPYGYRVRLSFTAFDTENGFDFIQISSNSTGLYERHSGSSRPLSLEGGQRMVARFRSDGSVNRRGFKAEFIAVYDSPPTTVPQNSRPPIENTTQPESCGLSNVEGSRVIGGRDAIPGAWPWQVVLNVFGSFGCGGSLIAPEWVVTAAHCIHTFLSPSDYTISLGDHIRNISEGTEQRIFGRQWFIHPDWQGGRGNSDIALIQLSRPAILNDRVRTVCLPQAYVNVLQGKRCFITGWGKIRHPGSSHNVLQQALLPVINSTYCQQKMDQSPIAGFRNITREMVCGGEEGSIKSGCHGDSGGPYVCQDNRGRWVLQGAVSWGSQRCDARENFTVFARVSQFRAWIDRILRTSK